MEAGAGQDILAQIIGATVKIIPLIAVPFILKGIIDGVPVLGSALQKGFNKASNTANKGLQASGLGARRRAQVMNGERNMFGRLNTRVGKDGKRRSTTLENIGNRRTAIDSSVKGIEKARQERFRDAMSTASTDPKAKSGIPYSAASNAKIARLAHEQEEVAGAVGERTTQRLDAHKKAEIDNPNSVLGQLDLQKRAYGGNAAKSAASTDARWKEATTAAKKDLKGDISPGAQALNASLASANLKRGDLVRTAQETSAHGYAGNFADQKRQDDFAEILERAGEGRGNLTDQSLLNIASGSVDATGGSDRAQASATQIRISNFKKNTDAARSIMQKRMNDRQLELIRSTDKHPTTGEPLNDRGEVIQAPNTILEEMMRSGDANQVLAARDEFMSQGQSGVMSALRTIDSLEAKGAFVGREEILTQLKRTQLSEYGKQTKESASYAVKWANGAGTMRQAMQDQGRYKALTDDQLADQSTASLLTGVANGSIDQHRAERILTDDKLRSKYDQEQTQILQMVKDHGAEAVMATWNPDDGKLWSEETSTVAQPAPTYANYRQVTEAARKQPAAPTATDPNAVDSDTVQESNNLQSVLVGDSKVPKKGSPIAELKEFSDKASGVSRMSRETFTEFQESLNNVPEADRNENDYKLLVSQTNADRDRRNTEAVKINREATRDIVGVDPYQPPAEPIVLSAPYGSPSGPGGGGQPASPSPAPQPAPSSRTFSTEAPTVVVPSFSESGAAFTAGTSGSASFNPQNIGPLSRLSDADFNTLQQNAVTWTDTSQSTTQSIRDITAETQRRNGAGSGSNPAAANTQNSTPLNGFSDARLQTMRAVANADKNDQITRAIDDELQRRKGGSN